MLGLVLLLSTTSVAQAKKTAAARPRASKSASSELTSRQHALDAAKQSADPGAVANASRRVIAFALRDLGALTAASSMPNHAVELYRRAIDFEDVPDAHLDLAAAYLLSARTDEALSEINDVVMKDSGSARAWHLQGRTWLLKKNYIQAADSLSRSLALRKDPVVARLLNQTRVAGSRTRTPTAKELVAFPETDRDALGKILAGALNDLGSSEARQQQFSLALAHFHEAERWDPQTAGLMRNIGLCAARIPDYKETARALRPVLAADPEDRVARTLMGTALFSRGSFAEAVQVFSPLRDSALDNPEVAYTWASSLVKINKYPEASTLLEKLETRQLSSDHLLLIAQTWSQMGNYSHTVSTCRRALQIDPNLPGAHAVAGLALIREDKPADAEQEFREELKIRPDDIDSQFHLAFVLLQQSKTEEGIHHLRLVLERKADHPEANYELGKQLLVDGKPADAIPYLEAAARLKPQLEPVHYQLQAAYRTVGRKEDADREAQVYREMKSKSRNITLPPPPVEKTEVASPQ